MILITRKSEDKLWWSKDKSNSEQVCNGDFELGQVMIVAWSKKGQKKQEIVNKQEWFW